MATASEKLRELDTQYYADNMLVTAPSCEHRARNLRSEQKLKRQGRRYPIVNALVGREK